MKEHFKYFLVEDFDPNFDYRAGKVISLTPQVSYCLGLHHIPYQTLEDFYDQGELRKNEEIFFEEQLRWFNDFDSFIKKRVSYCRRNEINLARACYRQLKYFVDSVIVQSLILKKIVDQIGKENEIVYVKRRNSSPITIEKFSSHEKSALFSDLLSEIRMKDRDFFFVLHSFGPEATGNTVSSPKTDPAAVSIVKRVCKELTRPFVFFLKYGASSIKIQDRAVSPRALFLHSGSRHLDIPLRKLRETGWRLFILAGQNIYPVANPSRRWKICGNRMLEDDELEIKRDCELLSLSLGHDREGRRLIDWVSEKSGFDVSKAILPYLGYFLENTCFEILRLTRSYAAFYQDSRIDYAISHTNSDVDAKSGLLAAKFSGVKTVGIQHGCQAFDDKTWLVTDIDFFDYYFTSDGFSEKVFKEGLQQNYVGPSKIFQSSHYLHDLQAYFVNHQHRKRSSIKRVLYVSTKLRVHAKQFNVSSYPTTWYFEYQKELIDFFNRKLSEFDFVYKHARMNRDYADKSIIPFITERKFHNITIESGPMREYLRSVDAVILDRPTTAFFEAMACGLPVLALYPDFVEHQIHPEAKRAFGKSLQAFSTVQKACDKIASFLNDDPSLYTNNLSLRDDDLAAVLSEEAESPRMDLAAAQS